MAAEKDTTCQNCASDPNFAIICSFFEKFAQKCGITHPTFIELQEMLENTVEVPQPLVDLHIKLLRKARKTVTADKWERAVIKFCHSYSKQDGWELERFGYKNSRIEVKLQLLKHLLEAQFDFNLRFKSEVNKLTSSELRCEPLGRDQNGLLYWCQFDPTTHIRVYREDLDDETWELAAKDRMGLVDLIDSLCSGEGQKELNLILNEDSNSAEKPIVDTGQQQTDESQGDGQNLDKTEAIPNGPELTNGNDEKGKEDKPIVNDDNVPEDTMKIDEVDIKQEVDMDPPSSDPVDTDPSVKTEALSLERKPYVSSPVMFRKEPFIVIGSGLGLTAESHKEILAQMSQKFNDDDETMKSNEDSAENNSEMCDKEKLKSDEPCEKPITVENNAEKQEQEDENINICKKSLNEDKEPVQLENGDDELRMECEEGEEEEEEVVHDKDKVNDDINENENSRDDSTEEVSEAVEDPVLMVKGEGSGEECHAGNIFYNGSNDCSRSSDREVLLVPKNSDSNSNLERSSYKSSSEFALDSPVGEAIEEPLMLFVGEGNGMDCDTGNTELQNNENKDSEGEKNVKSVWSIDNICTKEPGSQTSDNIISLNGTKAETKNEKLETDKECNNGALPEEEEKTEETATNNASSVAPTEEVETNQDEEANNNLSLPCYTEEKEPSQDLEVNEELKTEDSECKVPVVIEVTKEKNKKASKKKKRADNSEKEKPIKTNDVDNRNGVSEDVEGGSSISKDVNFKEESKDKMEEEVEETTSRRSTRRSTQIKTNESEASTKKSVPAKLKPTSKPVISIKGNNQPTFTKGKANKKKPAPKTKGKNEKNKCKPNIEELNEEEIEDEESKIDVETVDNDDTESENNESVKKNTNREKPAVSKNKKSALERKRKKESIKDEEESPEKEKEVEKKKPKKVKSYGLMGLMPSEVAAALAEEGGRGVRQSRRLAQIKMKEQQEQQALEKAVLNSKQTSTKHQKKSKKSLTDEDDKKGKKRKKRIAKVSDAEFDQQESNDAKKGKSKRKRRKKRDKLNYDINNPWKSSSDSSTSNEEEDLMDHYEEEEEEEELQFKVVSDHEFSPESDLEKETEEQAAEKRARTAGEDEDPRCCEKCQAKDHPEWILLCDKCDQGWHASCLRPPLMHIPEGDWFCPKCQHATLIDKLKETLRIFERGAKKRENDELRRKRLAYVGISLSNVLPPPGTKIKLKMSETSSSSLSSRGGSRSRGSSSSRSSSVGDSGDEEPFYQLRVRRQANQSTYALDQYDKLISSAIGDDDVVPPPPKGSGKDMATITAQQTKRDLEEGLTPFVPKASKFPFRKKPRKLNCLDDESVDDSDSDFKGSVGGEEEETASDYSAELERLQPVRRSSRAVRQRIDREFINDDTSESSWSEGPKKKKGRPEWRSSSSSESEDKTWGSRKKKKSFGGKGGRPPRRKKFYDDSDSDGPSRRRKSKPSKPRVRFGLSEDDDDYLKNRTRGKKINYQEESPESEEVESKVGKTKRIIRSDDEDDFQLEKEKKLASESSGSEIDGDDEVADEVLEEEEVASNKVENNVNEEKEKAEESEEKKKNEEAQPEDKVAEAQSLSEEKLNEDVEEVWVGSGDEEDEEEEYLEEEACVKRSLELREEVKERSVSPSPSPSPPAPAAPPPPPPPPAPVATKVPIETVPRAAPAVPIKPPDKQPGIRVVPQQKLMAPQHLERGWGPPPAPYFQQSPFYPPPHHHQALPHHYSAPYPPPHHAPPPPSHAPSTSEFGGLAAYFSSQQQDGLEEP